MRYLTLFALKMDKSSLNSSNISFGLFHVIQRKSELGDGTETLVRGQRLPLAQLRRLHFFKAVKCRNRLVH